MAYEWLTRAAGGLRRAFGSALVRDIATTSTWNALGKVVGFFIPFFVAAWYGVTPRTDAFFFSYGLALFLCGIFEPVVRSFVVPFVAETRAQEAESPERFLAALAVGMTAVMVAVIAVSLVLAGFLLPLVTDFEGPVLHLAYVLLLELSPLVLLIMWTGLLSGTLNAYKKFAFPAVSPAFRAVIAIAVIFALRDRLGVHAVAAGYVAGEAFRVLALSFLLCRVTPLRFKAADFAPRLTPKIRRFLGAGIYQMVALTAIGLNPVVDRTMASWLPEGSVSVLYYADRLYVIPTTLFLTGVMVVVLSHWSDDYYREGAARLRANVRSAVRIGAVLASFVAVVLMLLSGPLTRLAFGRGEFPEAGLPHVARVWVLLLAGLLPHCLATLYARGTLTLKDTRTLMKCGVFKNGLNITLNYILMLRMGVAGIALSTTLTHLCGMVYLRSKLYRRLR